MPLLDAIVVRTSAVAMPPQRTMSAVMARRESMG